MNLFASIIIAAGLLVSANVSQPRLLTVPAPMPISDTVVLEDGTRVFDFGRNLP